MKVKKMLPYMSAKTLIRIIVDAVESNHLFCTDDTRRDLQSIVIAAWSKLIDLVGIEDAIEMAADAGLTPEDLGDC